MILSDIARALGQLGDPRFLRVVLKAVAITILILAGAVWLGVSLFGWFLPDVVALPWVGSIDLSVTWISWAAVGVLMLLSIVLMVPVASVFVSLFLDDVADAVEARHYAQLGPVQPLPLSEAMVDSARFLVLMAVVNAAALLIYLLSTIFAPFVFWAVNGFLLGREYAQLVAARRIGSDAARTLRKRHFVEIWALGALMAVPLSIPVVNLFVPVLGVAAYCHWFHRRQV